MPVSVTVTVKRFTIRTALPTTDRQNNTEGILIRKTINRMLLWTLVGLFISSSFLTAFLVVPGKIYAASNLTSSTDHFTITDPDKRLKSCGTYNYIGNIGTNSILYVTRHFAYQCVENSNVFIAVEVVTEFGAHWPYKAGKVNYKFIAGEQSDWVGMNLEPLLFSQVPVENFDSPDFRGASGYKDRIISATFKDSSGQPVKDLYVTIRMNQDPPFVEGKNTTNSDGDITFDRNSTAITGGNANALELAYKGGKPVVGKLMIYGIKYDDATKKYIYGSRVIDSVSDFRKGEGSASDALVYDHSGDPIIVQSGDSPPIGLPEGIVASATKALGYGGICGKFTTDNFSAIIASSLCSLGVILNDAANNFMKWSTGWLLKSLGTSNGC